MEALKSRFYCPFSLALNVFGDKWSLLIIRDMAFFGKDTYGDFLKSFEGIATNILAARLSMLEENGIIEKLEHPDSKAKALYKLTPKGIGLLPVLVEIFLWAEKYYPVPEEVMNRLRVFKEDKEGAIKKLTEKLEKR